MCDCVRMSLVCPHYRFRVIVCPRICGCSPAQQEATGVSNTPWCLLRHTLPPLGSRMSSLRALSVQGSGGSVPREGPQAACPSLSQPHSPQIFQMLTTAPGRLPLLRVL